MFYPFGQVEFCSTYVCDDKITVLVCDLIHE